MGFEPESCHNKSEVISKLIVTYLLPQLGCSPDSWHQEVKVANIRLYFLTLVNPIRDSKIINCTNLFVKFLKNLAPGGVAGSKLLWRFYSQALIPFVLDKKKPPNIMIEARHPREKLSKQSLKLRRLVFEYLGGDISNKINDIRDILGKKNVTKENILASSIDCDEVKINRETHGHAEFQNSSISGISNQDICKKSVKERSSMRVIAIYHNKGGVGKTTVSVNLAASLSRKGKRVLLIDMDAQANTTFATGLIKFQFEEDDNIINNYVYHLLESRDFNFIPDMVRCSDEFNNPEVDVVPSHIDLIEHQDKLNKIALSRSRLIAKLKQVKDSYDIVIIDTPPSRDLYAEIPLIAADYLIIPSDLKPFANQGLNNVKKFVQQVDEYREAISRDPLVVLGVLPSKISTNAQYLKYTFPRQKDVVSEDYNLPLMKTIIYERTPLSNALNHTKEEGDVEISDPKSIFEFCELKSTPSAEQSARDFESLAAEVMNNIQ